MVMSQNVSIVIGSDVFEGLNKGVMEDCLVERKFRILKLEFQSHIISAHSLHLICLCVDISNCLINSHIIFCKFHSKFISLSMVYNSQIIVLIFFVFRFITSTKMGSFEKITSTDQVL